MAFLDLFGFKVKTTDDDTQIPSVIPPNKNDGSVVVDTSVVAGGWQGHLYDIDASVKTENEQIRRYREVAGYTEVDSAIVDIVNESIVSDQDDYPVKLELDNLKISNGLKAKFQEAFVEILNKLDFNFEGHDIFRKWYVDGKIYYHILFKNSDIKQGISELRLIDPLKIKKIRDIKKKNNGKGVEIVDSIEEYYIYNDKGISETSLAGVKLTPDSVVMAHSGNIDGATGVVVGYLSKAIKPANQLKMIEDAIVIFTMTRAPDRRIFYIDVGNLPKIKAEQYVNEVMNKFKNKLMYNASTGELADSKRNMSMIEDFWMPRRDGCFSMNTRVKLLDGRDVSIAELTTEFKSGKVNWTYSVSPDGKVVPGLITWAGVTKKNATVIDVTLDNGAVITCTPEHKFILRDGQKTAAEDMLPGTALMPISTEKCVLNDIEECLYVKDNETKRWSTVDNMAEAYFNKTMLPIDDYVAENISDDSKVVSVVYREDKMDVGTLTVDGDNEFHDYHNYALTAGVFVMNSKGTEITTLQGSQSLIQAEFLSYFQNKLYQSLNVPIGRLKPETGFTLGRSSETTRDELKFNKFVGRLRVRFSSLFHDLLRIQLIAKGLIRADEWNELKSKIRYDFIRDNHFTELKDAELLTNRLNILNAVDPYVGKYYSRQWVCKNILMLDDEGSDEMIKQINDEIKTDPDPQPIIGE